MKTQLLLRSLCVSLTTTVVAYAAGGTATFRLSSARDGATVPPGTPIPWTITVSVSTGDNAGLALALVDLVQAPANPQRVALEPASGVPRGLEGFSAPLGISNPGDRAVGPGYLGLQRGLEGAKDLRQIGGAQNTLGLPGALLGRSVAVAAGVAQGSALELARGTIPAPGAPGRYVFSLANALANTLEAPQPRAGFWRTSVARAQLANAELSFTVTGAAGDRFVRGDANTDGQRNIGDPVTVLGHLFLGSPSHLDCPASADADGDGRHVLSDAVYLLNFLFLGGPAPPAPFPACGVDPRPGSLPCDAFRSCH